MWTEITREQCVACVTQTFAPIRSLNRVDEAADIARAALNNGSVSDEELINTPVLALLDAKKYHRRQGQAVLRM